MSRARGQHSAVTRRSRGAVPQEYLKVARRTSCPWLLRVLYNERIGRKEAERLVQDVSAAMQMPMPNVVWKERGLTRANADCIEFSAKHEKGPATDVGSVAHELSHVLVSHRAEVGEGPSVSSRDKHGWHFVYALDEVALLIAQFLR